MFRISSLDNRTRIEGSHGRDQYRIYSLTAQGGFIQVDRSQILDLTTMCQQTIEQATEVCSECGTRPGQKRVWDSGA